MDIAAQYKVDQAAWKSAAANLRQPYWDWAATAVPPTEVYKDEEVNIVGFDGKETSFKSNPFLRYRFRKQGPQLPSPFDEVDTTLRYPSLNNEGKIVSDPERFRRYVLTSFLYSNEPITCRLAGYLPPMKEILLTRRGTCSCCCMIGTVSSILCGVFGYAGLTAFGDSVQ